MLKLFNTLTNKLEEFKPIEENKVKMYVCGPTVYDKAHLGHARCYITWDVLYRYLKFLGYDVTYARNVTDVDDKILKKADTQGVQPENIAKEFYNSYINSMTDLNVLKPDIEPFATKTLGEMISMVKELINKDFAYVVDDDVYFEVSKFKNYGQLSKQPIDDLMAGARVEADNKKRSPLDFALWKKDELHGFNCPWNKGRPGWHIECSAMIRKHLGKTIDIHAGGADLQFPHHENEIAQSEAANGEKFVNYWLHNGFVTINKEKMSKSLNNFLTIDDLLKTHNSNTIRFFILTNHYRMPVEFNDEALSSAQAGAKRLINSISGAKFTEETDNESIEEFKSAMNEDLNTSKALAVLFSLADKFKKSSEIKYANTLKLLGEVLGFNFSLIEKEISDEELKNRILPLYETFNFDNSIEPKEVLNSILKERWQAKLNKDWAKSDLIRDEFKKCNLIIKDSKEGSTWELA